MYALQSKTKTLMKRYAKALHVPNPFEFDNVNNPAKKPKRFKSYVGYKENGTVYYQCNQNLLFEVWKELKPKMNYKQWCKEEGLSITPQTQINGVEHAYWVFKAVFNLTKNLLDLINTKYLKLFNTDNTVKLLANYLYAMGDKFKNIILSTEFGAYEVSILWCYVIELQNKPFVKKMENADVSNECWKYINEVRYTLNKLNDFSNYALIPLTQINFLNLCEKNKKGYIINNVSKKETNSKVLTESVKKMKTVNGKNKMERMINKPLKYMGLVVKDSSSNKHMYAEIQSGDFNKYAYFQIFEEPHAFKQSLANGKTIDKLVFHLDNFDDGKGHDAIFVPAWMSLELIGADVTDPDGYLVAFERNQWNNPIIEKLNALNDGADSVKVLNEKNIKELRYHY